MGVNRWANKAEINFFNGIILAIKSTFKNVWNFTGICIGFYLKPNAIIPAICIYNSDLLRCNYSHISSLFKCICYFYFKLLKLADPSVISNTF